MASKRRVDNLLALAVLSAVAQQPMHPYEMGRTLRGWGKDRDFEIKLRENRDLLNELTAKIKYQENLAEVFDLPAFYARLTPEAIAAAARTYLNPQRYVQVTLSPESGTR